MTRPGSRGRPRWYRSVDATPTPEKIKWAMQMHGHGFGKAAEHIGVNKRTVQRWVSGEAKPKQGFAVRAVLSYIYGASEIERRRQNTSEISATPGAD